MVVHSVCDSHRPTLFSSARSFFDKEMWLNWERWEVPGHEEKFGEEAGCWALNHQPHCSVWQFLSAFGDGSNPAFPNCFDKVVLSRESSLLRGFSEHCALGPPKGGSGHVPQPLFSQGIGQSDEVWHSLWRNTWECLGWASEEAKENRPRPHPAREDTKGVFAADGSATGSVPKAKSEACF